MAIRAGIFGDSSHLKDRYVSDHKELGKLVKFLKEKGMKIVLTSGSFDLLHIGHARYLENAKSLGDVLIVGVDSDKKIKDRKGSNRPIVHEEERLSMLAHLRSVDIITLKKDSDPKLNLLKIVRPDVLVVSKTTGHTKEKIKEMKSLCEKIAVLEPQSETSTSAKVRKLHIGGAGEIIKKISPQIEKVLQAALTEIEKD